MILARLLILGLAAFEFSNLFGILDFTLDFSWVGLIVTSLGVFAVIEGVYYISKRNGATLPVFPYYFVAFSLWFDAMGDVGHFYGNLAWYDQAAHFLGGAAVMSVALGIFSRYQEKYKMPLLSIIFISLAFTALFGDLYEMEEYLEDKFYHGRQVRLGDGPDTANDLMLNLSGGAIVGAIYFLSKRKI